MAGPATPVDYVHAYDLERYLRESGSRIPLAWIKAQARAGRIPHLMVGRRMFFRVADVQAAITLLAGGPSAGPTPAAG